MTTTTEIARLRSNPFTLVPDEKVTVWAGYEQLRSELFDIVESCRSDRVGLSEFAIIHGDYGTGKSHALRYLQHRIIEREQSDFDSPCVYLATMKVAASMDFVVLYRKIMESLIPHIQETAEWLDLAVEDTVRKRIPDGRRQELEKEIDEIYGGSGITPGFPALSLLLRGIRNGTDEALQILLAKKLSGQRAMAKYRSYNMTGPIESEYDATKCLGAYVNLCTRGAETLTEGDVLGRNKAFYFFFDELEIVGDFRPQEALSLNQGLRDLVNACPENCCFLFGMSGDVRDIYVLLTTPVIRRMSRDPLTIAPLEPHEAVDFLTQVLKGYRSNESDPDEYPFEKDALFAIAEGTQNRTPSELFRACRRVLEKAVLSGTLTSGGTISAGMVSEFL